MQAERSFGHDGSIAPLLGLLQSKEVGVGHSDAGRMADIHAMWPGMGTEVGACSAQQWLAELQIIFELWGKDHAHYLRALSGGKPLETVFELGVLDMVKLEVSRGTSAGSYPQMFAQLAQHDQAQHLTDFHGQCTPIL